MKNLPYVKPILIINVACLILGIWLIYKHYFYNDGKGVDEYILALSIYSLSSIFGIMSISQKDNYKKKSLCLILGLIYVICIALFLEKDILYGYNMLQMIIAISLIPFLLFCVLLLFVNKQKVFERFVNSLFIFSFITSILPLTSLVLSVFAVFWMIFKRANLLLIS